MAQYKLSHNCMFIWPRMSQSVVDKSNYFSQPNLFPETACVYIVAYK
jgi:hypothetical protein